MDHQNLDKLFQEQLNNLEVTPNKKVWSNIESKLKKKKKKVIPIWWFTSVGVAAMLVIGILIYPFSKEDNELIKIDSKNIITESSTKKTDVEGVLKTKDDSNIQIKTVKEQVIIIADKKAKQIINNNKERKKLVSKKNAVKKIFLADNALEEKKALSKEKKENVEKNESINADKTIFNQPKEIIEVEKKLSTQKVDFNRFVNNKDSVFSNKNLRKKWFVAPVFAVLNSNSFSNSSPVDKSLSNSTEGKNSFSYGFQVGYKINDKWTIQSGIHMQEMNYVNKEIAVVSSISRNASAIVFNSGDSFSFEEVSNEVFDLSSNSILDTSNLNGDLNQTFGYVEIPLEVKYLFIDTNKFNTQIVAGFSSLILNKNQINLNTKFQSQSGEATNLNNINFSGNLGVDFNYLVNKNWSLNLNPMFKAQLNTFNQNSNGFSPFNIGLYTGVKYRF